MGSRHAPSPSPPPPSQHPAYSSALAPPMTAGFLPNTTNHADMQHVLNLVKELSDQQAQNRQSTSQLIKDLQILGNRRNQPLDLSYLPSSARSSTASMQQAHQTASGDPNLVEMARLRHDLEHVTQQRDKLSDIIDDIAETLSQYEDTLESIMVRVREFADQHTTTLIGWHNHYSRIVQHERDRNHRLRMEHSHWQQAVGRLADNVRNAYDAQNTLLLPYERRIAGLKRENKSLKRRCGLEIEESEDEFEEPTTEEGRIHGHGLIGIGVAPPSHRRPR